MPLSGAALEAMIFEELKAKIPEVYGPVIAADSAQRKNIELLAKYISKAALPIVQHIVGQSLVKSDVVTPVGPGIGIGTVK